MAVVSCAGDTELAEKLYSYLASRLPPASVSLNEDEISIKPGVRNDAIRKSLEEFVGSNPDLAGYSITEFEDIFTVGIPHSIDNVILSCEMCGYIARDGDELILHRRMHALF